MKKKKNKTKRLRLTDGERKMIEQRRKFLNVRKKSKPITLQRKASRQSTGEKKIADFLVSEGVAFEREWYFKGLYNYAKSCFLYFDFYIPGFNLCIEFDGAQHYKRTKTEAAMKNDFLKNAYCAKNGINLLRIKYTDFDSIETLICEKLDKIAPITPKS
jgi:hypothetical protein